MFLMPTVPLPGVGYVAVLICPSSVLTLSNCVISAKADSWEWYQFDTVPILSRHKHPQQILRIERQLREGWDCQKQSLQERR